MFMEPLNLEEDTIPASREIIDFGTNNFIYEGTLYNAIEENNLDENVSFYIYELEKMMSEKKN